LADKERARLRQRVETADRRVTRVVWTTAARPFFAAGEVVADDSDAWFWRPPLLYLGGNP
jgi:hypothetical protein